MPVTEPTLENLLTLPEGREILACMQCGMCAGTCPYGEVIDYPPRRIIGLLRAGLIEEVLASDSLLNCVNCYACMAKCPRGIRLTDVLLPLVKEQVLLHLSDFPGELQRALLNLQRYGNPFGISPRKRADWSTGAEPPIRILAQDPSPVDVLWFVECYSSYTPRGQQVGRATNRVFHALGLDFAILGNEERCAGECGQRTWEPGLFDGLAEYTTTVLAKYRFNRIVTSDAHAYDAFVHRYRPAGMPYAVEHTTPFLARHLERLRPLLGRKLPVTVTYHDSCCLGRHSGFYEEPRAILAAIPGVRLAEMTHNRINSICCGGGGGGMWLDGYYKAKGYERLSERRVREALATGADVLAVSCPYEIARFEDALKVLGYDKQMAVRDVAELVAEALAA